MTVYFTGDHHFGHTSKKGGIIEYCNRPFISIGEMDNILIAEWNRIVRPEDIVYYLGDFTLSSDKKQARRYFSRLNGKVFVLSNTFHHDKRWLKAKEPYQTRQHEVTILPSIHTMKSDGKFLVLCHFPLAIWPRRHFSAIHLHGHSHGNYQGTGKILDVGVDSVNKIWGAYRPVSLAEVVEYMEGR